MIFFFFNDTATTEIYTLSLHDALPISLSGWRRRADPIVEDILALVLIFGGGACIALSFSPIGRALARSEEHTSELQSQSNLVCRLLLEKKKARNHTDTVRSSFRVLLPP